MCIAHAAGCRRGQATVPTVDTTRRRAREREDAPALDDVDILTAHRISDNHVRFIVCEFADLPQAIREGRAKSTWRGLVECPGAARATKSGRKNGTEKPGGALGSKTHIQLRGCTRALKSTPCS